MHPLLSPASCSVGVGLEVRHTAATRVGCLVRGRATSCATKASSCASRWKAFDQAGLIGEGEHTRAIVDHERLADRRRHDWGGRYILAARRLRASYARRNTR